MDTTTREQTELDFSTDFVARHAASDDVVSLGEDILQEETDVFGLYVAIGIFYACFGTFENSVVIYLFTRKNSSYAGNAYIIALAVLDILACTILAQIMIFVDDLKSMQYVYTACWVFAEWLVLSYLCVLAAMSLDRLTAVARPVRYQGMKSLQKYIISGIMTAIAFLVTFQALLVVLNADAAIRSVDDGFLLLTIAGCLVIIVVSYTIIIQKLIHQNSKVQSELSKIHTKTPTATKSSVHVTTVKVFVGVSILYVASYIPVVIAHLTAHHIVYKFLYMINHVGNPIIYYVLNKKFRNDATDLFRK